jgi:hypothetical protein
MKKSILMLIMIIVPSYAFSPINDKIFNTSWYEKLKVLSEKNEYVHKIIKTISWQESRGNNQAHGGSGERGEYQIMPATWNYWCVKYFGHHLKMTIENQNKIVNIVITNWVDAGYTIEQIAAKWNSGTHVNWKKKIGINRYGVAYNVPKYVQNFVKRYNKIKNNS